MHCTLNSTMQCIIMYMPIRGCTYVHTYIIYTVIIIIYFIIHVIFNLYNQA